MKDNEHSDHYSQNIDYEALWELFWMAVPLGALVCFVLWLIA